MMAYKTPNLTNIDRIAKEARCLPAGMGSKAAPQAVRLS